MTILTNPLEQIVEQRYREQLLTTLQNPKRLEAVYGSKFWQEPQVEKLRQFCVTAAKTLDTPISQISLITNTTQRAVAAYGLEDGTDSSLDFSVCQHTVGHKAIYDETDFNIVDANKIPLLCNLRSVTENGIKSYLGVPLIDKNSQIIGAFCVADYKERNWDETDVLMLAHLSTALITMHEAHSNS